MSTTYYLLKEPVTKISLKEKGAHARLRIWVEHGLAGELVVPRDVSREMVRLFANKNKPILHTSWGGTSVGVRVAMLGSRAVPVNTVIISEAGEVTTLDEVMALKGRGAGPDLRVRELPSSKRAIDNKSGDDDQYTSWSEDPGLW